MEMKSLKPRPLQSSGESYCTHCLERAVFCVVAEFVSTLWISFCTQWIINCPLPVLNYVDNVCMLGERKVHVILKYKLMLK